jgi:hypothetical protein
VKWALVLALALALALALQQAARCKPDLLEC